MIKSAVLQWVVGVAGIVSGLMTGDEGVTSAPTINLGYATYEGKRLVAGVDEYLGMRYAQPPLGKLRFRAPQDPSTVSGIQPANKVSCTLLERCSVLVDGVDSFNQSVLVSTRPRMHQEARIVYTLMCLLHPTLQQTPTCQSGSISREVAMLSTETMTITEPVLFKNLVTTLCL